MKEDAEGRGLRALSAISYIAAGIVLLLGVILLVSFIATASNLGSSLMGLRILGLDVLVNLLVPQLRSALITSGVIIFAIAILLSSLLYAVGRLVGVIRHLMVRVARLESQAGRSDLV